MDELEKDWHITLYSDKYANLKALDSKNETFLLKFI
jgi:hypothetical protein